MRSSPGRLGHRGLCLPCAPNLGQPGAVPGCRTAGVGGRVLLRVGACLLQFPNDELRAPSPILGEAS